MLSSGIMQRAFVEAIVLGLACGPLGVWILLLKRSYAAESLSHAMLPGLVIAALAGLPLFFGAAAGVLVAAILISAVRGDVGVAVVVSGLFGLGGILALSPETPPRLGELLFGDLLGVTTVAAVQGLGNLLLVALILAPAAAALNLANRLPQIISLAAAFAVIAGVAGLVISYELEIAAGASIALCAVALSSARSSRKSRRER